ncbi:pisatin demethylase [Lineolata rhizophorae]|uniref:Cytochrome P450 monooxygenase ABA1 n=1 Tax=Lineolata rhizophorae TaxID=578093 RepID=A0A6A6NSC8_9PEZI|nr:pisatin demethylase [Lineolata rhizophorae]
MALSLATLAGIVIVVVLAFNVVGRVRAYSRLSHVPGPRLAAWSRLWIVRAGTSGRNHEYYYEANVRYGPLARIGPNHLLTSDPDIIRRMNAPRSPYRRSGWYSTFRFKPRSDNIISVTSEERHEELRKKMAAGYGGKEVPFLESYIDKHIKEWVELIRQKYISTAHETKPMDMGRTAQYFTLDVISDLAFNHPFGDIPEDTDKFGYIKTTEDSISAMQFLSAFPHVHRWIEQSRLMDLLAPKAKDRTGLGRVVGIAHSMVAERFGNDSKGRDAPDMLGSFLRHGLTQEEAESETVLQIMAGSDTSATIIRVVVLNVITSPHILGRLRAEIDEAIRDGKISSPIKDSEAKQLPYLQSVIKEALRLWPPVTGLVQKVVGPEGDTIDGKFIPGGTFIGQNSWALGRNESIYGPDFALYRPERWLEASGKDLVAMERNSELTFGYGRFKCLGQPVALMELNKVFVELFRRFDMAVMNPAKPWSSESFGIFLQKDFWVRITERSPNRK